MHIVLKVKQFYKAYKNIKTQQLPSHTHGKQKLSIYCIPDSVLGIRNIAVTQADQVPTLPQPIF